MKLSVLVPLYNEQEFVATLLKRVIAAPLPPGMDREIIVADDGSRDASVEEVQAVQAQFPGMIQLLLTDRNRGKGSAIKRCIAAAGGDFCIIQDADLEYDPNEYMSLLAPLVDGRADAVFGSRFLTGHERRVLYFWHSLGNQMLTLMCNVFADLNLTDMETCYKAFRTPLLKSIPIKSLRFGFEPEITIKLAKRQARIYETSISYNGRTYEEGKKIGLKDAFDAFWVILTTYLSSDIYVDKDKDILDAFSRAKRFNNWMADTIKPYAGKRILDIGAGIGNLTKIMINGRRSYTATDLDEEHLERLRVRVSSRPGLRTGRLDASVAEDFAAYREPAPDTVICLNVMEHIKDDIGVLRNIHGILAPGGTAIILVPEGPEIYNSLDDELGHFKRYTEAELRALMVQAGYAVETILKFNRISRPAWWFNGGILKRRTVSRAQLLNFDRVVWFFRKIDRFIPWKPTSIIAIGRKPE